MAVQQERPPAQPSEHEQQVEVEARSRSLRNGLISLAIFFALLVGLLLAVPGLRAAAEWITDANPGWVLLGIALEVLSCVGYVVVFHLVFAELSGRLTVRLSLSELAMNSVVSVSGLAGLALGAWVLATKGVSARRIARGTVLLFVLTSVVNVVLVVVIGVFMWLGVLPGSDDELLTLLPAALAAALILGTLAIAAWARRASRQGRLSKGRVAVALDGIGCGVAEGLAMIRRRDWRLLGAVGYCVFDILTLYACLRAFGRVHAPNVWVVAMAYLVGMLANTVPTPAGLIAVEGGLVGMLVLFGVRPATLVVAAVVIYRAISLWVPALIGSVAFLRLRGEIGKPLAAAGTGKPLAAAESS